MHYFLFDAPLIHMMCQYKKTSVVKRHHIYKVVWIPVIGEELHAKLEEDNEHDEHAVAVILYGRTVGHLPIRYILWPHGMPATPFLRLPGMYWRPGVY